MAETVKPKRPPTLGDQLAAQHELLMATLSKQPTRGSESVSLKQASIGDLKGRWICDNMSLIRAEDEDYPAFLGRVQASMQSLDRILMLHNADEIKRQLEASTT
jgi:hypothetical protein